MHHGLTSGAMELHSWFTALGQQGREAQPGRLGVLRLTYRPSSLGPQHPPTRLYPSHNIWTLVSLPRGLPIALSQLQGGDLCRLPDTESLERLPTSRTPGE